MNNKKQLNFQTIAVDFDGTLCYSKWPELGQPNQALIEYLQEWKRNGNKLILWTCRAGEALSKATSTPTKSWMKTDNLSDYHQKKSLSPSATTKNTDSKCSENLPSMR